MSKKIIFENRKRDVVYNVSTRSTLTRFKILSGSGRRTLCALMLLCFCSLALMAQKRVTGTVTDPMGDPVPGTNVVEKGTLNGTITDIDGKYTLEITDVNTTLLFSFIGYISREIPVGERSTIDVVLSEDTQALDELIVVGYGTTRRRNLIGAVEQIGGDIVAERANMNVSRSLQGQIPGMTITLADGKPSRNASISLRGTSSIGAGGSALILIDGVEAHGDLTTVNPADIESISVLKDASSAAIYGAKGAFGVVLITTKKASQGKARVNYNGGVSMHKRIFEPDLVWNGLQWTNGWYKAYIEGQGTAPAGINNVFKYNADWYNELVKRDADPTLEKVRVNKNGEYEYFGNTNWFDVIYRDHTLSTEHNLSVSGGSEKAKYYVSGRYFNQGGIYTAGNEDFTQYNFRAKGSLQLSKQILIENNTDFIRRSIHQPMVMYDRQLLPRMLQHQGYPMTMPKNPDGTWTETAVYTGWAGFVEGTSYQHNNKFDLKNTTTVTYTPIKELILKADYSYYFNYSERDRVENMYDFYTGPLFKGTRHTFNSLENQGYNNEYQASNFTANYIPKFSNTDHILNILAGVNTEHKYTRNLTMYRRGLIYEKKPTFALMDGDFYTLNQTGSEWSYAGLLYRVNYSYKDRYLMEISGRYDGSSKFPSNQRFGFFPSGQLGWIVSDESFMSGTKKWLDMFKLRFTAGSLGNGAVDPFLYMSNMTIGRTSSIIDGTLQSYTYAPGNVPSTLTWETNTTYDAGFDFLALRNRLSLVFDYYHRYTTDMFTIGVELPAVFGSTIPKGNNANLKTKGWEVSLQWQDYFNVAGKPLNYSIKGMLWDNRSWVTKYNNVLKSLGSGHTANYYEGMEIGEMWGYHIEGLFRDQEEINNHANQSGIRVSTQNILAPGDLKFADLNNDGFINTGANTADDPGDRRIIGNSSIRYNYGVNLGVNWNGMGLSAVVQGIGKRDWYPHTESAYFWGQYDRAYSFMLQLHTTDNVWTEENQNFNAYWPRYRAYLSGSGKSMGVVNDRYLQNTAYVRLKNMQVDYSFNSKICKLLHLEDLRVYIAGENLWTWSPMFKVTRNFDPEVIGAGDPDFRSTAGTDGDGYGYPQQATYTFGLNVTF